MQLDMVRVSGSQWHTSIQRYLEYPHCRFFLADERRMGGLGRRVGQNSGSQNPSFSVSFTLLSHKNLKQMYEGDMKRGKLCARESRLVLVLLLIGLRKGRKFFKPITKHSKIMQNQTKHKLLLTVK